MKLARYISTEVFEKSFSEEGLEIWLQPPTVFEDGIEGFGNGFSRLGYVAEAFGQHLQRVSDLGGSHGERVDMVDGVIHINDKKRFGVQKFAWYDNFCETYEFRNSSRISCWFMHEHESLAMWDLYGKETGVCVLYDLADLICTMREEIPNIIARPVVYERLNEKNYNYTLHCKPESLLLKDKSYEHEREFRFLTLGYEENPLKITLPLPDMIISHPRLGLGVKQALGDKYPTARRLFQDSSLVGLAKHSKMKQFLTDLYNEKDEFAPRLASIRKADLKKSKT